MIKHGLLDIEVAKTNFLDFKKGFDKLFQTQPNKEAKMTFNELFNDLKEEAINENLVCQDILSYYYKNGYRDIVAENYTIHMKWLILAGAEGNCFSLNKLSIFLNHSIDEIVYSDDFPAIKSWNMINELNYEYVIGKVFCSHIVKELKIDPKVLATQGGEELFSAGLARIFDAALEKVYPAVLDELLNRKNV